MTPQKKKVPLYIRGTSLVNYFLMTLIALRPFGPFSTSKLTESPSARDLNPLPWMEEWWTKTSLPSSLVIKPKPLESLNHFTVPVVIIYLLTHKFKSQNNQKKAIKLKVFMAIVSKNF